jgi:hypothetical protein
MGGIGDVGRLSWHIKLQTHRPSIIDPCGLTNGATQTILSMSSTASLNHFALHIPKSILADYDPLCFHKFANLTSLNLTVLTDALCDVVIQAKFRSMSFVGDVESFISGEKLKECQRLVCGVERFEFRDQSGDWCTLGPSRSTRLVDAITDLQSLQHLVLSNVSFDVTRCSIFSRLTNLKSVNWIVYAFIEGCAFP